MCLILWYNAKSTILGDIWAKQLFWNNHPQRMYEERLPLKILNWVPAGRRKRRPKTRWKEGVLRAMEEYGLRGGDLEDRLLWSLGVERRHTS
jgi:hypothetical protein